MAKGSIEPAGSQEALRGNAAAPETRADGSLFDLDVDPAQLQRYSRPSPWRLSHLMYLIAAVAVLLWLGVVVAGSVLAVVIMIVGLLLFCFVAAMGGVVVLAWGSTTKQDCALAHPGDRRRGRGMPLAPAVAAFADHYWGWDHRRVMHIASRLNWVRPAAGRARRRARARHS